MRGDKDRLVERAGRVAGMAIKGLQIEGRAAAGGMLVYCAGCRLAVDDRLGDVADAVRGAFGALPFLGCFTFGEQGAVHGPERARQPHDLRQSPSGPEHGAGPRQCGGAARGALRVAARMRHAAHGGRALAGCS